MELNEVVARRRMVRSFVDGPVDRSLLLDLLDRARRAPSAGNSQGVHFVVLARPDDVVGFWDRTLPASRRATFRWQGLLRAPVLVLPCADPSVYLARYGEPDKAASGLGRPEAWPVPYWEIDAAFATMQLLLLATDRGLGALFFGLFRGEADVVTWLGIPEGVRPIGAVALGWPAPDEPGRSAGRPRRPLGEVMHEGRWGVPLQGPGCAGS
jgi:nitroreductase